MQFLRKFLNPFRVDIDAIQFDHLDWPEYENNKNMKAWRSGEFPAQLSINFFPKAPDMPGDLSDLPELQSLYRDKVLLQEGGLILVEKTRIEGHIAVETLFKIPMKA